MLTLLFAVSASSARELKLEDRVAAQRAIEQVYWNHRIWPSDNKGSKPPLSAVMPDSAVRAKVEDALRKASLLDSYWHQPLRGEQLQKELDRMVRDSKSPEILRELFAALHDDPFLIAECLARPALAERAVETLYPNDERIHGAQRDALAARLAGMKDLRTFERLDGDHEEVTFSLDKTGRMESRGENRDELIPLAAGAWSRLNVELDTSLQGAVITPTDAYQLRISPLLDRGDRFVVLAVRPDGPERLRVSRVSWAKRAFGDWLQTTQRSTSADAKAVATPPHGYFAAAPLVTGCLDDTWTPIAPATQPRDSHTAVWTGVEMIAWGGYESAVGSLNTGERYDPALDSWTPTTLVGAPSARHEHAAVWTGTKMIVWGGFEEPAHAPTKTGSRYNPASDSWSATRTNGAPSARYGHTAVWTGSRMIVWGGHDLLVKFNSGASYDPGTDSWVITSTGVNVPETRVGHTAVWTGSEMVVWGGDGTDYLSTGGRYNPTTNTWLPTSDVASPEKRTSHSAVWTGSKMIVWSGFNRATPGGTDLYLWTGGLYNPASDSWAPTNQSLIGPRVNHTAIWTGSEMVVWGGSYHDGTATQSLNRGGRYDLSIDRWSTTSLGANVPTARGDHTAVWTGSVDRRMIVFGGYDPSVSTGAIYCAGECTATATTCSDGNLCSTDVCQARACVSTPITCIPVDGCHDAGTCNPVSGSCPVGPAKPNGIACSDGNACTESCPGCGLDECVDGQCGCPGLPGACDGGASSYSQRSFTSIDIPKTISAAGTPVVTSTLLVSGYGRASLVDVDVTTFMQHSNTTHLDITLQSPAGTVVTLSTDNGGTNLNLGHGTAWDDDANPGGQVPYTTNNGLVTDRDYSAGWPSVIAPEEALGAFNGESPNGTWTLMVSDDTTGDGGSIDNWSLNLTTVDPAVVTTATSSFTGAEVPKAIPGSFGAAITSRMTVSGIGTSVSKLRVTTGITHTNNADLDITLTSPGGTIVTLTTDNGGTTDNVFASVLWDDKANPGGQVPYSSNSGLVTDSNYANAPSTLVPEEGLAAFRGENPNGGWILKISDDVSASNNGSLNSFSLEITTASCPQSCARDCNDGDTCTAESCGSLVGCGYSCSPGSGCVPSAIANIGVGADKVTLTWDHTTGGTTSVHDLVRGRTNQFPVGSGAAETCLAGDVAATTATDSEIPPPGVAFWYAVRGQHLCGAGTYGSQSNGTQRSTTACP